MIIRGFGLSVFGIDDHDLRQHLRAASAVRAAGSAFAADAALRPVRREPFVVEDVRPEEIRITRVEQAQQIAVIAAFAVRADDPLRIGDRTGESLITSTSSS